MLYVKHFLAFINNKNVLEKGLLFSILFLCFIKEANSQNKIPSHTAATDSIFKLLDTIPLNKDKIKFLGTFVAQQRYAVNSRLLIDKAIAISKKANDPLLLANSYYSLGNYYFYNTQLDSSLIILERAYEQVLKTEDRMLQSSILTSKGGVYGQLGIIKQAISYNNYSMNIMDKIDTLSLDTEEKTKLKGRRFVLLNAMANLYNKMEDFDIALLYYDAAFEANLSLHSDANASVILNNKGDLLIQMGRYEEALEILIEAKRLKEASGLPKSFIATTDLTIGMAYFGLKNTEKAMEYYQKALAVNEAEGIPKGIMQTSIERGNLYLKEGQLKKALEDCAKAKEIAIAINDKEYIIKACNCLYLTQNKLGNFKESLRNHELLVSIKDSVFNEKNIRKMTQVEMQYQFDQKEAEQQLVQDLKTRRNNLTIGGLIILAVFLSMLFVC